MKRKRRARRRFSAAKKARLAAEGHRRRSEGESFRSICKGLDVVENSLRRWMQAFPAKSPRKPALAPVKVLDPPQASTAPEGLVLTTPSGLVVAGLDVDSAAALLERLQ